MTLIDRLRNWRALTPSSRNSGSCESKTPLDKRGFNPSRVRRSTPCTAAATVEQRGMIADTRQCGCLRRGSTAKGT
jgi:hypothetical protein